MTRKNYCGNLLWQSSQTLLAPSWHEMLYQQDCINKLTLLALITCPQPRMLTRRQWEAMEEQ